MGILKFNMNNFLYIYVTNKNIYINIIINQNYKIKINLIYNEFNKHLIN